MKIALDKVLTMRDISGCGLHECLNALLKVDGDIKSAINYIDIKGDAVCRRHKDGTLFTDEDYVKMAKGLEVE